jgi:hypothetical protein
MLRWLAIGEDGRERAWFSPGNASIPEWRYGADPYRDRSISWELARFNDKAHLVGRF